MDAEHAARGRWQMADGVLARADEAIDRFVGLQQPQAAAGLADHGTSTHCQPPAEACLVSEDAVL